MDILVINLLLAGLGGIAGAGLIGTGSTTTNAGSAVASSLVKRCPACLLFLIFGLSIIEWWLLDLYNEHPPIISYPAIITPSITGLVTGMAVTTIANLFNRG